MSRLGRADHRGDDAPDRGAPGIGSDGDARAAEGVASAGAGAGTDADAATGGDADPDDRADGIDPTPPRGTVVAAAVAAALAATATLIGSPVGGVVAFAGAGTFVFGLYRGRDAVAEAGVGGLLAGVLVAGAYGATPLPTVAAIGGVVLAWELARHGRSAAAQVGTGSVSERAVAARGLVAGGSVAVAAGVVYGAYALGGGGRPLGAVVLLVLGATLVGTAATARRE